MADGRWKTEQRMDALRGFVGVVPVAGGTGVFLPPTFDDPGLNLRLDAIGKISMDGDFDRCAGPLAVETHFVNDPGATIGLSVAVLAAVRYRNQLHVFIANPGDSLDDLDDGRFVTPFGGPIFKPNSNGENRLISFERGECRFKGINFLFEFLRFEVGSIGKANLHERIERGGLQRQGSSEASGLIARNRAYGQRPVAF